MLDYSSADAYFRVPMGRDSLQKLWQKYNVDIAVYGHAHAHHYKRSQCICIEKTKYEGPINGTIHIVAGSGGANLNDFSVKPKWSLFSDINYGFVTVTTFNHSYIWFEYKRSSDGIVHDSFEMSRDYKDILACSFDSCPATTLAF